jgi:hypothetical protein
MSIAVATVPGATIHPKTSLCPVGRGLISGSTNPNNAAIFEDEYTPMESYR